MRLITLNSFAPRMLSTTCSSVAEKSARPRLTVTVAVIRRMSSRTTTKWLGKRLIVVRSQLQLQWKTAVSWKLHIYQAKIKVPRFMRHPACY